MPWFACTTQASEFPCEPMPSVTHSLLPPSCSQKVLPESTVHSDGGCGGGGEGVGGGGGDDGGGGGEGGVGGIGGSEGAFDQSSSDADWIEMPVAPAV